jgi:YcxB-like protein
MSVTYVLSWDEFLELHKDSLPGPSITSFVSTMAVVAATGIFGAVLTWLVDPPDKWIPSMFLGLALILLACALWDLKFRTAERRKKVTEELHFIYERDFADERTFAFDQNQWSLITKAGKYDGTWTSLSSAVERENTITLSGRSNAATVPKRVLGENEMESLRRIALHHPGSACLFHVTPLDFMLTEVPSLWRRHSFLMGLAHLAGLWFFALIAYTMYYSSGPGVFWAWIVAWIILFFALTTQFWYFLIKYYTSLKLLRFAWGAEFSEEGLRWKAVAKVSGEPGSTFRESFQAWRGFRKARETARCFLLYIDPSRYLLLPKKCLSREQMVALRELLQAKVGHGSE